MNFIIDGFSNINHKRIINLSIYIEFGIIYLESFEIDILIHGGYKLTFYINKRVLYWIKNDFSRVNSIVINIESKMRVMWVILEKIKE